MRENYDTSGPGKYEGEPPIVRFIWEHLNWLEDESWEADWGYQARAGKWIVSQDERGFVTGTKFASPQRALKGGRELWLSRALA